MRILSSVLSLVLIVTQTALAADKTNVVSPGVSPKPTGIETPTDLSTSCNECYSKWHKRLAYLTLAMTVGAIATHEEKQEAKDSHKAFGMAAGLSFLGAGYMGFKASSADKSAEKNNVKFHRWLGYAAIPLMILLPLSGIDADKDYKDGHNPDGIGKMKGALTGATVATLVATTGILYFEF